MGHDLAEENSIQNYKRLKLVVAQMSLVAEMEQKAFSLRPLVVELGS